MTETPRPSPTIARIDDASLTSWRTSGATPWAPKAARTSRFAAGAVRMAAQRRGRGRATVAGAASGWEAGHGQQLVGHQRLELEPVVLAGDDRDVDGPRSHPGDQLVVVAVQHRHREGRVTALEAGQQRGQDGGRDARHRPEADMAGRDAAASSRSWRMPSTSPRIARLRTSARSPSVVRTATPRPRRNRSPPSSSSSARTARLTPGWLMCSRRAASPNPPHSATVTNARSCASVMRAMRDRHWPSD